MLDKAIEVKTMVQYERMLLTGFFALFIQQHAKENETNFQKIRNSFPFGSFPSFQINWCFSFWFSSLFEEKFSFYSKISRKQHKFLLFLTKFSTTTSQKKTTRQIGFCKHVAKIAWKWKKTCKRFLEIRCNVLISSRVCFFSDSSFHFYSFLKQKQGLLLLHVCGQLQATKRILLKNQQHKRMTNQPPRQIWNLLLQILQRRVFFLFSFFCFQQWIITIFCFLE